MAINKKRLQGAAESSSIIPSENFETVLYTGNGASQNITGLFKPDLVWIKNREDTYEHFLFDSVRGAGGNKDLNTDSTNFEGEENTAAYGFLSSFNTNGGFSVASGTSNAVTVNNNNDKYVGWCFKAPDAFSHSASGSQLASSGKSNQTSGFSIVSYTGNNSSGATVKHNLGGTPELMIVKRRDATSDWDVYSAATGPTKYLILDTTQSVLTATSIWNDTAPDDLVFTIGNHSSVNENNGTYISYCFKSIAGYSKVGSFQGTGANQHIDCGFEPAWVMIKNTENSYRWYILDNQRNRTNPKNRRLFANDHAVEATNADILDFTTTGFQIITADSEVNQLNKKMIFLAFAADPDTTTPTKAKSFNVEKYEGTGSTQQIGSVNTLFTKFVKFNGTNSYIEVPVNDSPSFLVSTTSFWVRTNNTTQQAVVGRGYDSGGYWNSFQSYVYGDTGKFVVRYGNGTQEGPALSSTSDVNTGEWFFCAVSFSGSAVGSTVKMYVNGVLETTHTTTKSRVDNAQRGLIMGAYSAAGTVQNYFNGDLDQVRIFNTVLTASQILELYRETAASASTVNYPTGAGCIALYEFNDNAEDTADNSDGTGYNITFDSFLFKPDLTIIKNMDQNDGWRWFDTQRGVLNRLISDDTSAAANLANSLTEFNNGGFTVGSEASVNTNNETFISYNFKMLDNNNNVPIENTVGTIKSLTSVNALAGMSIAKYTGNKTQNATIGTGLSSSPDMVIIKNLDQTDSWFVSHSGLSSNQFMELDNNAIALTNPDLNHERLSTTFKTTSSSPHDMINGSGENYIMYSFISISGFSKYGSYSGSGSAGKVVTINFKPDFVMIKRYNSGGSGSDHWLVFSSEVVDPSGNIGMMRFDTDTSFFTGQRITFDTNSFTLKDNDASRNGSGGEYIFWAMKIN